MLDTLLAKVVGTQNDRELKRLRPIVSEVNALEAGIEALSDEQLRARTAEFKQRVSNGETLDELMPEAFAVVRESGRRVLTMRHFDVQLIGGAVLHKGKIAEMKTGEGKTLVATLPAYLNALGGQGVHVVTVNDYLARRDSEWMGRIYRFLGMTVGVIQHELNDAERQVAYAADITYGTNNEFGFDYLRDNMKFDLAHYVQRGHHFAIVDEVDSILIDEARTPLIISGPAEESTDLYYEVDRIIPRLKAGAVTRGDTKAEEREALEATGDYIKDEKHKTVTLTETGMAKAEQMLAHRMQAGGLYDPANMPLLHHINQGLRAHSLFHRDVDYMVKEGEVIIVDEFTGRLMPGRRWSDGLHQAVEAKERVHIREENQTLATITIQNYFRMYKKLAGMTGTADTEAPEFKKIYKLDVMVIPTHRTMVRDDLPDVVYRSDNEKYDAVVQEIEERNKNGQPILVGTTSVAKSERLSRMLKKKGIKHNVLNAVNHEAEASIIAQAGRFNAVTIATNMAGRGTDILLGGNPEFLARSDMENEWISRATKLPTQGAARYEDALRQLRENYEEEVQKAEKKYVQDGEMFEQKRGEALKRTTDLQREIRAISPFRDARERYEDLSATELIDALHHMRPIPDAYLRAKQALEAAILNSRNGDAGETPKDFEEARQDFSAALERWQQNGGERQGLMEALDERRRLYEQQLIDLEFENARAVLAHGEHAEVVSEYEKAHRAFEEAEVSCDEIRVPYEQAVQQAQQSYETKRQEYLQMVEQVREQLDKAPEEFRHRFDEILAEYNKVCAHEKEKVITAGGLHILGTERHESRRIDNQLRGRAGRQGDPGSSRFYLSLEDDLMRIFG